MNLMNYSGGTITQQKVQKAMLILASPSSKVLASANLPQLLYLSRRNWPDRDVLTLEDILAYIHIVASGNMDFACVVVWLCFTYCLS